MAATKYLMVQYDLYNQRSDLCKCVSVSMSVLIFFASYLSQLLFVYVFLAFDQFVSFSWCK